MNPITVLIGHNGASKTMVMSIVSTGLYQPTAGTATTNGCDIRTEMDQVSQLSWNLSRRQLLIGKGEEK